MLRTRAGGSIGRIGHRIIGAIVAAAISAPVLSRTSAAGAAPLVLGADFDATVVEGMWGRLNVWSDAGKTTHTTGSPYLFLMTGDPWELALENIGLVTPAGAYWAELRIETNPYDAPNNVTSAYSNTVTDNIGGSVAAWFPSTGVNKHSGVTVSGTPALTATATNINSSQAVRMTVEANGDYTQFEVTVNSLTGTANSSIYIGWEDGTDNLNPGGGSPRPGVSDSKGVLFSFNNAFGLGLWATTGVLIHNISGAAGEIVAGDIFTFRVKKSTNKVELWRTRGGTTTVIQAAITVPALSHYYAYISIPRTENFTANPGNVAFTHALDGGCVIYG